MIAEVERTEWADIYKHSGLSPEHLEKLAKLFLESERSIFCWGMGITPMVRSPCTLLCPRTGQSPAPGLPICPRANNKFASICTLAVPWRCCVIPIPQPWALMNYLALNYSTTLIAYLELNHREKMGMVSLKLLKPWQKVRSKSLLVWVGTLQLQRQIRRAHQFRYDLNMAKLVHLYHTPNGYGLTWLRHERLNYTFYY
jgi:hypothetical protein